MEHACASCGALNAEGTEFCGQCGVFLAWDTAAESAGGRDQRVDLPAGHGKKTASTGVGATRTAVGPVEAPGSAPAPVILGAAAPTGRVDDDSVTTTTLPSDVVAPVGDRPETCPACTLVNDPGRRFCAHCGFGFAGSIPEQPAVGSWTQQSQAEQDREARRAYRRSLPPVYRWRRVIVGGTLGALVVTGAVVVRHPVMAVRDAWYGLEGRYVRVAPVTVAVEPATATAPGSDPGALVDGSDREWTQAWAPTGTSGCGAAPGTADIVLSFAPTRVRQLQVWPGLAKSNPGRLLQPVPRQIGVTFPGQVCHSFELDATATGPLDVDSRVAVTSVRVGVAAVRPSGTSDAPLTSLTEVIVRAFPR